MIGQVIKYKPFTANDTILGITNYNLDNIIFVKIDKPNSIDYEFNLYDDPFIGINNEPEKHKILLIETENDLIEFNNKYGLQVNDDWISLDWNKVVSSYAGIIIDDHIDKIEDSIIIKYFITYIWIDDDWHTNCGYLWRYKNVLKMEQSL